MKKILYSALVFGAVALTACKVTDLTPEERISDATFWSTVSDLELYCNSFYVDNLQGPDPRLDRDTDNRFFNQPSNWLLGTTVVPNNSSDAGWTWTNLRNINYFLTRYQKVQGLEVDINHYAGEMRFFRALEYFNKIKRFGDVPWYDRDLNINDEADLFKARDPRSFIVGKIIEDLEWAAKNMKLQSQVTKGRLHSMAAYHLLARVCLHEATQAKYRGTPNADANALFAKAAEAAKIVMDKGGYEIVKAEMEAQYRIPFVDPTLPVFNGKTFPTTYFSLFNRADLSTHKEAIMYRIYIKDVLMHNTPRVVTEWGVGGTKDLAESYLCSDGRPIAGNPLYLGDDSVTLEVLNRDPRMGQTLQNKTMTGNYENGKASLFGGVPPVNPQANPGGYAMIKFFHPDKIYQEAAGCDIDWFIFRYAETLLIYAEAKAELGQCDQAVLDATVNKLRDRVGMPHLTVGVGFTDPNWPDYGYAVSPLLHEIRRERRVELAFEGLRYDDMLRWGAIKSLMANSKTVMGINVSPALEARYPAGTFGNDAVRLNTTVVPGKRLIQPFPAVTSYPFQERCYLYPLPQDQLQINTNLKQNPGWN